MAAVTHRIIPEQVSAPVEPFNNSSPLTSTKQQTSNLQPRDVTSTLNFFKDNEDGSPPAPNYVGRIDTYERPVNSRTVTIHDIRGSEEKYTLDGTGFQVVNHVSKEKDFLDDEQIKAIYYPETEELLKKATGASKIFIFDHTIRRQPLDSRATTTAPDTQRPITLRGPVQRVHIDQSYAAGPSRVRHHLKDEADHYLKGRYQIINVWRPIKTILKDPLGVADARSVSDDELVPIKLIYPDREGETCSVRGGDAQKWHYLFRQTPEEVMLIKCFDSKTDGRARRVPHSSFVDQEFEDQDKRESIEVRALVFHPDDTD